MILKFDVIGRELPIKKFYPKYGSLFSKVKVNFK